MALFMLLILTSLFGCMNVTDYCTEYYYNRILNSTIVEFSGFLLKYWLKQIFSFLIETAPW